MLLLWLLEVEGLRKWWRWGKTRNTLPWRWREGGKVTGRLEATAEVEGHIGQRRDGRGGHRLVGGILWCDIGSVRDINVRYSWSR
jgi:hypothetical protein